jgi:hypothetical protein
VTGDLKPAWWVWDAVEDADPEMFSPSVVHAEDAEEAATTWMDWNHADMDYPDELILAVAPQTFDGKPTMVQVGDIEVFRVEANYDVTFIAHPQPE